MKRLIAVAAALALVPLATAQQLYKHTDKDGRVVYTDQPPPNADAKAVNIPKSALGSQSAAKSYVAQDKELDKKRKADSEKQAKAGDSAQKAQEAEKRCAAARSAYQTYADGGRIYKNNDKGERVFLNDAEIDAERDRSRREMDEACKGR